MTCNLCHPLCQCGAEEAVRVRYVFQERVRDFLRQRSPEVQAVEALLQAYAVAR